MFRNRLMPGAALAAALVATAAPAQDRPRILHWAGHDWIVKGSMEPVGPGPNAFSGSAGDVYVDKQGWLHLKIVKRFGQWQSTEIASLQSFGYGTYRFDIAPTAAKLPGNAVLGLFTYDMADEEEHREIDVEMSQWGDGRSANVQCSIQPAEPDTMHFRFPVDETAGAWSTAFRWAPGGVDCGARTLPEGDAKPQSLGIGTLTHAVPHPGNAKVRLNLWMFHGQSPDTGKGAEVVVRDFRFTPLQGD